MVGLDLHMGFVKNKCDQNFPRLMWKILTKSKDVDIEKKCNFFPFAAKQIHDCSLDKQEGRGRLEVEVKPVELALTEEHMSCVTGRDQRLTLLAHVGCC